MSEAADRKYDDVSTAANRVLIKCAVAFEKRWLREDEATRGKLLEQAIANSTAFGPPDAERIRANTRDVGVICQLLEAIATAFGINPDDPSTVRQYRNSLVHPRKAADGQYGFLNAEWAERFLQSSSRMVKTLRSKREEAEIQQLATFMRQLLNGDVPAAAATAQRVLEMPAAPYEAESPTVVDPPFPMPKVIKGTRKPLDPEDNSIEDKLSDDQRAAVDAIAEWFHTPGPHSHFAMSGAAGTGKTTVTGAVVRRLGLKSDNVYLVAPTGKAVEALKDRLPRGWKGRAKTLASFLWKFKMQGYDGEDATFAQLGAKPLEPFIRLVIVDEASMVTKRDFAALKQYARVLYTGDSNQLPPVVEDPSLEGELGSCGVLDKPHATLERVHRHGVDTSLHQMAEAARAGKPIAFGTTADGRVTHLSEADGHFGAEQVREIVLGADVVLTQRNSLRVEINEYVRRLRGFMTSPIDFVPKAGEILVSSENYMHPERRTRVANGERFLVTEFVQTVVERMDEPGIKDFVVVGHPEGRPHEKGEWTISSQMLSGDQIQGGVVVTSHVSGPRTKIMRCDWGYALTVHKAQGSEWPRVVVVDDNDPDHNVPSAKWNYVAYSRASEQLVVLKVSRETGVFLPAAPGAGK